MPGPPYNSGTPGDAVVTEVVQINNVSATQLVPVLRPLMSTEAQLAAYPQANVLIVSDRASNVTRLLDIIQRIDQATDNDVEVIPLQNAPAADVVQVLTSLMQADASGQNGAPLKLVADERTNSILVSGDKGQRLRIRALTAHLDMPLETGNTQVVYLRYAKAKDVSDELKGYVSDLQKQGAGKAGVAGAAGGSAAIDISVIPDDRTNALVITAPPKAMHSVQDVISKLDIRRAQVLVQAIQAELTSDKSAELGVTWVADAANSGVVGVTDFSNGAGIVGVGQGVLGAINSGGSTGTQFTPPGGLSLGLGKISSNGFSFATLLRALAGDADTNILSTPSVVTLDNEEATIKVTQKVPFVTGQYTNASAGAAGSTSGAVINPFQTVDRQDVGITLKITPQINEGDSVLLKIDQSVSNLAGNSIGGQPVTNEREINTSILAKSGEIVVLGGLIDHDLIESEQRVPILGAIPLIGNLFKYRTTSNTKRNLMVFLQPTILRDSDSSKYYTNDRYNYFRDLQLKNQSPVQLMPGNDRPLLDELKALDKTPPAAAASASSPAAATMVPAAPTMTPRPAQAPSSLPANVTAAAPVAAIPPATPAPTGATTTKAPGTITARTPPTATPAPTTASNPPRANPDAATNHGPEDRRG
jgi:general secretion pathway protein D